MVRRESTSEKGKKRLSTESVFGGGPPEGSTEKNVGTPCKRRKEVVYFLFYLLYVIKTHNTT